MSSLKLEIKLSRLTCKISWSITRRWMKKDIKIENTIIHALSNVLEKEMKLM